MLPQRVYAEYMLETKPSDKTLDPKREEEERERGRIGNKTTQIGRESQTHGGSVKEARDIPPSSSEAKKNKEKKEEKQEEA